LSEISFAYRFTELKALYRTTGAFLLQGAESLRSDGQKLAKLHALSLAHGLLYDDRMRNPMMALMSAAVVVAMAGTAEARHVRFHGAHPIAAKHGGGYCYINAPHFHAWAPEHAQYYQQDGDGFVFVGQLPDEVVAESPRVVIEAPLPPAVTVEATAPDVEVRAQAPGVVFEAPPPPRVVVHAPFPPAPPGVVIEAPPPPRVEVRVPAPPSVEIRAPFPPPPPHVVVRAPAPPSVTVTAPGVYVRERHHGDDDNDQGERWHHDNGKHKGWR
jgi:hypothetical protein